LKQEHVLSNALLEQIRMATLSGPHWIAFEENKYLLDDAYFFKRKEEAHDFAFKNNSAYELYKVICADSRGCVTADTLSNTVGKNNLTIIINL
jgi:hypothetical protein